MILSPVLIPFFEKIKIIGLPNLTISGTIPEPSTPLSSPSYYDRPASQGSYSALSSCLFPEMAKEQSWKSVDLYSVLQIDMKNYPSTFYRIHQYITRTCPHFFDEYHIKRVDAIWNSKLHSPFVHQCDILERRAKQSEFKPSWNEESNPELRKRALDVLNGFAFKDLPFAHLKILPVFHATREEYIPKILNTGFAALQLTDSGYFGKGIYFTSFPDYALKVYGNGSTKLILTFVCVGNVFPVTDQNDIPKLLGKSNYKNYDTHYALVKPSTNDPNEKVYFPISEVWFL
jgi:hypothetical protein